MDHNVLIGHVSGHVASILTMAAYLLKDILWLRLLTILSCFAGIAFNFIVPATPLWTVIYWNVLFALINIVQVAIIIKQRSDVHFTEEEKELHATLFKNFAPFEFMKLMRIGKWFDLGGSLLLTNGGTIQTSGAGSGHTDVISSPITIEGDGGSYSFTAGSSTSTRLLSFITGGTATATVRALQPTRYVSWPKEAVKQLLNRNPSMRFAMQAMLSTDLSKKLMHRAPSFHGKMNLDDVLKPEK